MVNLIKMDTRRLFHSNVFLISLSVVALFNIVLNIAITIAGNFFMGGKGYPQNFDICNAITGPFYISLFIALMFISMVSFSYADISNGYIKNIAGQLPRKTDLIFSKFIVIGIHNLVFLVAAAITNILGYLVLSAIGLVHITSDGLILAALLTLLLKWMLSMAICSILLFITMGIKNKNVASIVAAIFGTGALGLAYMGLNQAINGVFHTSSFDLGEYMPDTLINVVNAGANTAVINTVIVSVVCSAIFLGLTYKVYGSRDVK